MEDQRNSARSVQTITADAAQRLIDTAAESAAELGRPMVITVVDPSGNLVALRRMDGAPLLSIGISQDKAYTAAGFGRATHQWHDAIKDDAPLKLGIVHTPRLVTFGGGYPIVRDGSVIGGIGLSGGHYSEDMKCAEAALKASGFEA